LPTWKPPKDATTKLILPFIEIAFGIGSIAQTEITTPFSLFRLMIFPFLSALGDRRAEIAVYRGGIWFLPKLVIR